VLPGTIGILQATEAIKLLTHIGEPLIGRLPLYDALRMQSSIIRIAKEEDCPACGDK
jgi:adenylyltransferase/sulfurtransferase